MKCLCCLASLFLAAAARAQPAPGFGTIDWAVRSIEAPAADSLARQLVAPYPTELQKVRAIFSWMAQHIAYNTGPNAVVKQDLPFLSDTAAWPSALDITAALVLQRRVAVCDGYAKLFKSLCDHAGLRAEVIVGYARPQQGRPRFRTNHSWNAVRIDSVWRLVDVTWGSGFINGGGQFVQATDEAYFLAPPAQFIRDHYPDDLRWTLLGQIPSLYEFRASPYRCKSYVKYGIRSFLPSAGIIEAAVGDTVRFELEAADAKRDSRISSDPFFDSSIFTAPASAFLHPVQKGNHFTYAYVVTPGVEWLHLLYNDDLLLRYRLKLRTADRP